MNVSRPTSPSAGAGRTGTVLHHSSAPFAALPLGGIGTGNVSIGADGALRQWQLHNIGNHNGELPDSPASISALVVHGMACRRREKRPGT